MEFVAYKHSILCGGLIPDKENKTIKNNNEEKLPPGNGSPLRNIFFNIWTGEKKDSVSAKYIDEVILTAMKQIKTDSLSGNLKRK